MSYNGAGTFIINSAGQPAVSGAAITATAFNALTADLATGLSTALCKDGQSTATANLPMGGFKLTGMADGSAATDSITLGQAQGLRASYLTVSGSTTITANASPALTAYATGQAFWFRQTGICNANPTINIDGLGAKNLIFNTNIPTGGLLSGYTYVIVYNGSSFDVVNPSSVRVFVVSSSFSSTGTTILGDAAGDALTISCSNATIPNNLAFDTDVLFIDATNNRVGVGTTTPSQLLSVSAPAAADAPLLLKAPSTNKSIVNFGDTASDTVGSLQYDHATDNLIVTVNGSEAARVLSSGNVGIGTASPGQKLTVAGTIESTTGGVKFPDATVQTTASKVLQQVYATSSAYASGTTTTPIDNSKPQSGEGVEFLTVTITPKAATSTLMIEVNANISSTTSGTMTSAVFRDSTANAIAAQAQYMGSNETIVSVVRVFVAAGSTSATTFKFRAGSNNAGTTAMNGVSGSGLYDGVSMSTITVTEIGA